jgi:hypothetical protein
LARSQASTCGSRTASELTFQVASFIGVVQWFAAAHCAAADAARPTGGQRLRAAVPVSQGRPV